MGKNLFSKYFNSIKVQLKPAECQATGAALEFQFHKGTIKTVKKRGQPSFLNYFNSIKVQLKQLPSL